MNTLKRLNHKKIVKYLGTVTQNDMLNIVQEYEAYPTLDQIIKQKSEQGITIPDFMIAQYTESLLLGLEYLHMNGVVHKSIKSSNILILGGGNCKVTDFG